MPGLLLGDSSAGSLYCSNVSVTECGPDGSNPTAIAVGWLSRFNISSRVFTKPNMADVFTPFGIYVGF